MKFKHIGIILMLIMSIALLTACGPKEENTTTDNVDSTVATEETQNPTGATIGSWNENTKDAIKNQFEGMFPFGKDSDEQSQTTENPQGEQ